jgi:hypothetical protein
VSEIKKAAIDDLRMHDDSRCFLDLPATADWYEVRDHVLSLDGALPTRFLTDDITEAWIDFTFAGNQFTIHSVLGDYWFFVENPSCPEGLLRLIANHFASLLVPGGSSSK